MSSEETNARKTSSEPAGVGDTSGSGERQPDLVRRALIHAGWSIPIVLALHLPTNAFADYVHGDAFADAHVDTFADAHVDTFADAHLDHIDLPHLDHIDLPHLDHIDLPHSDHLDTCLTHGDHSDAVAHLDTCLVHGDVG